MCVECLNSRVQNDSNWSSMHSRCQKFNSFQRTYNKMPPSFTTIKKYDKLNNKKMRELSTSASTVKTESREGGYARVLLFTTGDVVAVVLQWWWLEQQCGEWIMKYCCGP